MGPKILIFERILGNVEGPIKNSVMSFAYHRIPIWFFGPTKMGAGREAVLTLDRLVMLPFHIVFLSQQ